MYNNKTQEIMQILYMMAGGQPAPCFNSFTIEHEIRQNVISYGTQKLIHTSEVENICISQKLKIITNSYK